MIDRTLFDGSLQQFRDAVARFLHRQVMPCHDRWERQGYVDRDLWQQVGEHGYLCPTVPHKYGGAGADRRYSAVLIEEVARVGASGLWGCILHSEVVAPYLVEYGSDTAKRLYLPGMARGERIGAIAMTEPGAGSDLQGLASTAVRGDGGYLLKGTKTFVTNGSQCDVVIVAARTDPSRGAKGVSLLVVDASAPGVARGRRLEKTGLPAQDTGELYFDGVWVPEANVLGAPGEGFRYLMRGLPWERLQAAVSAIAAAQAAIEATVRYTRERLAFGKPLFDLQNTRFSLAALQTEVQIGRVFVDRCLELLLEDRLEASAAAMAKYWCTDLQFKVMDACVQLHGGYGYVRELPVARAWADAALMRLAGGSNEVMKELIARSM